MDIFSDFQLSGTLGNKIYPIIFQDERYFGISGMSPSKFIKEMSLSTEERMEMLLNNKKESKRTKINKIELSPQNVIFQNYKKSNNASFAIINYTEKLVMFKIIFERNEFFQLKPNVNFVRLAPGMRLTFSVIFVPQHRQDYLHKIVFETLKEKLVVPIICVGPRPLLEFPDQISLPTVPVKKQSSLTMCIRNIGMIPATFKIKTAWPFSIHPEIAKLEPNKNADFVIKFKYHKVGPVKEKICIVLSSGERLESYVCADSRTVDVKFNKYDVIIPRAFIGLTTHAIIKIINNEPDRLDFSWMKNVSLEGDSQKTFESFEDFMKKEYGICGDVPGDQGDKTFHEDLQILYQSKPFAFHNKHFGIFPASEDVWPNSEKEIIISFNSSKVGEFTAKAFCEIAGLVERIPLSLKAICLGAQLKFDTHLMNMDLSFGSETVFDLIIRNEGDIAGTVAFKPQFSSFGIKIKCQPSMLCIKSGDTSKFTISLLAYTPGPYIEDLLFEIQDSLHIIKFTAKGMVNSPTLKIEPSLLEFGSVSIGFEVIRYLKIQNISEATLQIEFKIPTDGVISPSINVLSFIQTMDKPKLPILPREFIIKPNIYTITPMEEALIKIKLIAGTRRQQETSLELCLQNSEVNPLVIPITYNAGTPKILSLTPALSMKECFINHKNRTRILAMNKTDMPGFYYISTKIEITDVLWELEPKEGTIKPNETLEIGLILETQSLGHRSVKVGFQLFGDPCPVFLSLVDLIGVGPKVLCKPESLHWGEISVLQTDAKTITLSNICPIAAPFNFKFINQNSPWSLDVTNGIIEGEKSINIVISLMLKDAGVVHDKLVLSIENAKDIIIPLSAKGVSTSIVVNPSVEPILDLGYQFTQMRLRFPLNITNHGTKAHNLKWSTINEIKKKQGDPDPDTFFHFNPSEVRLATFENAVISVEAHSDKVQAVRERWYLYGAIEFGKKELLLESEISVSFIKPEIETSKRLVNFQINQGPYEKQFFVLDYVVLKNVSLADIEIEISTTFPFQIVVGKTASDINTNKKCPFICSKMLSDILANDPNMHTYQLELNENDANITAESDNNFDIDNIKDVIKKFGEYFDLVQSQLFTLTTKDEININLLFNGSFGQNYRLEKFTSALVIKYVGHPKKEKIKLVGEINYPDVIFTPINLNIECIPGSSKSVTIVMENVTPLTVKYRMRWDNVFIQPLTYSEPDSVETLTSLSDLSTVSHISLKMELAKKSNEKFIQDIFETIFSKHLFIVDHPVYNEMEEILLEILSEVISIQNKINIEYVQDALEALTARVIFAAEHESFFFIEDTLRQNVSEFLRLYPSMSQISCAEESEYIYEDSQSNKLSLHDILLLSPEKGKLNPFESQNLELVFCPGSPVYVKTIVMCYPQGGPTRYFQIHAESSDIEYVLDSRSISYGVCIFHETYTKKITLSNSGRLSFDFSVSELTRDVNKSTTDFQMHILSIFPMSGNLKSEQSVEITIVINPGLFGQFDKCLQMKIAHFDPICIQLEGWGFFPQIDVDLPLCSTLVRPEVAYTAIGTLSDELSNYYLELYNRDIDDSLLHNTPISQEMDEEMKYDEMITCSKHYFDILLENDWIDVTNKGLPNASEIDLAIERIQVYQHISPLLDKKEPLSYKSNKSFLDFTSRQKCLDFGAVPMGKYVMFDTDIVNYAPCEIHVTVLKRSKLPAWIDSVVIPTKIGKGMVANMCVTVKINPNIIDCSSATGLDGILTCIINIQVFYGVIIPVIVKVLPLLPILKTIPHNINFSSVICGDFKISSLPFVNVGRASCDWSAYIKLETISSENPYIILNSSGTLDPNIEDWIKILFKPSRSGDFNADLVIVIEEIQSSITIPVIGRGLNPSLEVLGSEINFDPVLPYSSPQELLFAVYNPNTYPVKIQLRNSLKCPSSDEMNPKYYMKSSEVGGITQEFTLGDLTYSEPIDPAIWEYLECAQVMPRKYSPVYPIFFGAPFTDGFNIIRQTRDALKLPLLNLDSLLMNSIAQGDTLSSINIRASISQAYAEVVQKATKNNTAKETEPDMTCWDEMDILEYEIETLLTAWETNTDYMKQSKKSGSKPAKSTKNAQSEVYTDRSSMSAKSLNLLLCIPESLLIESLQFAFTKYPLGFIVDNLNSKFLDTPGIAFMCILKSLPDTKHIQLIVFHNSYEDFAVTVPGRIFNEKSLSIVDEENLETSPSLVLMDAKIKFYDYDRDLEKLLYTVDNWDYKNKCLALPVVVTAKPKAKQKTPGKKSRISLKGDSASQVGSSVSFENIGLTSWIISSGNNFLTEIIIYNISGINCPPVYEHKILEKPLKYALYSLLHDDYQFNNDFQPFHVSTFDDFPVPMCFCDMKMPSNKSDCETIQNFILNAKCKCTKCAMKMGLVIEESQDVLAQLILPPLHFMKYRVLFSPRQTGIYRSKIFVTSVGCPKLTQKVILTGISDTPRINTNPSNIYSKVISKAKPGQHIAAYNTSTEEFSFGAVLFAPDKDIILISSDSFLFTNISHLPVEIFGSLFEESEWYKIQPTHLKIMPGVTKSLTITVYPNAPELVKNKLVCCIKDNPEVFIVNISSLGVMANFTSAPEEINFGKMLLYRQEDRVIELTNSCELPLVWKLRNLIDFSGHLVPSEDENIIPALSCSEFKLSFIGAHPNTIVSEPLYIDVYGLDRPNQPVLSTVILISAECYDVVFDCIFEPPEETHVNCGNVMVGCTIQKCFNFTNRGLYDLVFRIIKSDNRKGKLKTLLNQIEVVPTTGLLKPNDFPANIEIVLPITEEITLKEHPLIYCQLIDANETQKIVAVFPIKVSVKSHFNKYLLNPAEDVNLGLRVLGSKVPIPVVLTNTGFFAFNYDIVTSSCTKEASVKINSAHSNDTNRRWDKNTDISGNLPYKKMVEVSPARGQLNPQTEVQINLDCKVENIGFHCEKIIFNISDTSAEKCQTSLNVGVDGCIPDIDFDNSDVTFQDCIIFNNLEDYKTTTEMGPHCIFVKKDKSLQFMRTAINTTNIICVYLLNNTSLLCPVTLSIVPKSSDCCFTVDSEQCKIKPKQKTQITLSFTPLSIVICEAALQISIEMPNNRSPKVYQVDLIGQGVAPQILIMTQVELDEANQGSICLCPTFLNDVSLCEIAFRNISEVICYVNVQINEDMFHILTERPPKDSLEKWNPQKPLLKHCTKVLKQNETSKILVHFKPCDVGLQGCEILFDIVNNPYDRYLITVVGKGYFNFVNISNIPVVSYKEIIHKALSITPLKSPGTSRISSAASVTTQDRMAKKKAKFLSKCKSDICPNQDGADDDVIITYSMDVGYIDIGSVVKRNVEIFNHSKKDVYRFEFEPTEEILFCPSLGHIMPNERKDVIVSFDTSNPLHFIKKPFVCNIAAMKPDGILQKNCKGWDNRNQVIVWKYDSEIGCNLRQNQQLTEPNLEIDFSLSRLIILVSCCVGSLDE